MEHDDTASRKSGSVEFESSCHGIPKDYIKKLSMLDVRAEGGNDIVIDEKSSVDTDSRPLLRVSVYGGKKKEVFESIERHIGVSEEAELYHTWVNVSAMKRLAFLFEGGVESAGGIIEIVCMFVVLVLLLALFAFWQLVIAIIVLIVLALFSGGAALKYLRGTFLSVPLDGVDLKAVAQLTKEQVTAGRFVNVAIVNAEKNIGPIALASSKATRLFKTGIHIALLTATLFLVLEVVFRFLTEQWAFDAMILLVFGWAFFFGIALMDGGVVLRYQLSKKLSNQT
ncbi:MAG: hypothetical protein V3V85_01140 [Candidatus Thorarchaeota archaeon]